MDPVRCYTVGHSNHSKERLFNLLKQHGIKALVDVRSAPYSRYVSHCNKGCLERWLANEGIDYFYLGNKLGGNNFRQYRSCETHYSLRTLSDDTDITRAIDLLIRYIVKYSYLGIMCAEGDPCRCHRFHVITPLLKERGVEVVHILRDGSIFPHSS